MSTNLTLEIVLFNLKNGVNESDFLQASEPLGAAVKEMKGFVKRELLKGANGQWSDIVHWESLDDAMKAQEVIMSKTECHQFMGMIDESTMAIHHLQQQRVYQ